jgi:SAM-dependent methyltransferase
MRRTVAETRSKCSAPLHCMVCSCPDLQPAFFLPEFIVHTCPSCGHGTTAYIFAVPDSQARFGDIRWIETRDFLTSALQWAARRRYEELAEFSPGRRFLEVGCGTGEFLAHARQAGHSVTGLDISAEAVQFARDRYPGMDIRQQPLESAELPTASFDVVVAFHLLEHVSDPVGLLRQMMHLLRPGGLVYVRVPNLDSWYRRVIGRNWWAFSVDHRGYFTASSLRTAFGQAGIEVSALRCADSSRESMWPVIPLELARGGVLRSLGNALQPPPDQNAAGPANARRMALKRQMLAAYGGYRRACDMLIHPLLETQDRHGGSPELMAIGRNQSP